MLYIFDDQPRPSLPSTAPDPRRRILVFLCHHASRVVKFLRPWSRHTPSLADPTLEVVQYISTSKPAASIGSRTAKYCSYGQGRPPCRSAVSYRETCVTYFVRCCRVPIHADFSHRSMDDTVTEHISKKSAWRRKDLDAIECIDAISWSNWLFRARSRRAEVTSPEDS